MIESLIIISFILNAISVQTIATQPLPTWDHQPRDVDDNDEEQNPNFNCLLFGDAGCHLDCYLSIDIYYYNVHTVGTCDEKRSCRCRYAVDAYLPNIWSTKFDADYVYRAIRYNPPLFNHVYKLFQYPLRTAEKFKQILHSNLSPYQYYKLQIHDDSLASMFTTDDGRIDEELVQQYVSDKLQPVFNSDGKYYFYTDYKQNFRDALKNVRDEGTVYNLSFGIRRLKIKTLEGIWQEFLTANQFQEPDIEFDDKENLDLVLHRTIISEEIRLRDRMNVDHEFAKSVHEALNSHKKLTSPSKKFQRQPTFSN